MSQNATHAPSRLPETALVRADALARLDRIDHAFFTRQDGFSGGLYRSLNAGIGSKDDTAKVLKNRALAMATLGVGEADLATPWQVHSAEAVVVDRPFKGERPRVDGVVSATPGLAVGVVTADCGPILFADAENGVVGAAHSGWRGALGGIVEATVAAMETAGAERSRIVAVLGPTITQRNYEVGTEMMAEFLDSDAERERFFAPGRDETKRQFDLPGFILSQIEKSGATGSFVGRCTYGEPERFFSFRRTTHHREPDYGRQLSAILIKD